MQKYKVVTVSRDFPDMRREVTLSADNEQEVKNRILMLENKYVGYSLLPSEPIEPSKPDSSDVEEWEHYEALHARYQNELDSYSDRWSEANANLTSLKNRAEAKRSRAWSFPTSPSATPIQDQVYRGC
jgi:CRISPR/Cas system Type II protein with McrA/HNH and RuvC-like nuclease domain